MNPDGIVNIFCSCFNLFNEAFSAFNPFSCFWVLASKSSAVPFQTGVAVFGLQSLEVCLSLIRLIKITCGAGAMRLLGVLLNGEDILRLFILVRIRSVEALYSAVRICAKCFPTAEAVFHELAIL